MNIKDYLHLYLGCDVLVAGEDITKLKGLRYRPQEESIKVYTQAKNSDHLKINWIDNIQPTLRPLSDMNEAEFREVLYDEATEEFGGITFIEQYKNAIENISAEDVVFTPHQFKYLLSKHFDLFGLIVSGLAISKSEASANG